jgi:putative heme iron utilization protein
MPAHDEAATGRRLIRSRDSGILSTMSRELPGYPFGSVTPYVMTHGGELVVYVSTIAQHTANMLEDPKVSLTVIEHGAGNQQALGRVTVIGDAGAVPERALEAVSTRYFQFVPEAEAYAGTHGFSFFWIEPKRIRFIGGFGQIFWIEAEEWRQPTPEWAAGEQGIIEHMNADHTEALAKMAAHYMGVPADSPRLIAVDPEGTHLRNGEACFYVPFAEPAFERDSVRTAMIELARNAG